MHPYYLVRYIRTPAYSSVHQNATATPDMGSQDVARASSGSEAGSIATDDGATHGAYPAPKGNTHEHEHPKSSAIEPARPGAEALYVQ